MQKISIIIPALNEAEVIEPTLLSLQTLRQNGHEVILADGGSKDNTTTLATPYVDSIVYAPTGRALQMNQGVKNATGDILLFLHADTTLPKHADQLIINALQENRWGRFDIQLSGSAWLFRVIEYCINLRSRITGIATGDQAIFVSHELFETIDGYPDIELMEDIALCRALRKKHRPICLPQKVISSSRYWEQHGIVQSVVKMWGLRLAYFLGVKPNHLKNLYYR